MGFREPESTITIRFEEGHRYHGLEATLHSLDFATYAAGLGWYGNEGWGDDETFDHFHKALISWNLTDQQDQPIPVGESHGRDTRLIKALNSAWIQSLTGVHKNDPLPESSTSGESSLAPPIPMTPVGGSESQAS